MNLQSQEHLLAPFDSLVWMYPESPLAKVLANVTDSAQYATVFVDLYLSFFFSPMALLFKRYFCVRIDLSSTEMPTKKSYSRKGYYNLEINITI